MPKKPPPSFTRLLVVDPAGQEAIAAELRSFRCRFITLPTMKDAHTALSSRSNQYDGIIIHGTGNFTDDATFIRNVRNGIYGELLRRVPIVMSFDAGKDIAATERSLRQQISNCEPVACIADTEYRKLTALLAERGVPLPHTATAETARGSQPPSSNQTKSRG